jgi:hypothetical protein
VWESTGAVTVTPAAASFAIADPLDYWRNLERLQFGMLVRAAFSGIDLLEDDD